jgi:hypothetical protein
MGCASMQSSPLASHTQIPVHNRRVQGTSTRDKDNSMKRNERQHSRLLQRTNRHPQLIHLNMHVHVLSERESFYPALDKHTDHRCAPATRWRRPGQSCGTGLGCVHCHAQQIEGCCHIWRGRACLHHRCPVIGAPGGCLGILACGPNSPSAYARDRELEWGQPQHCRLRLGWWWGSIAYRIARHFSRMSPPAQIWSELFVNAKCDTRSAVAVSFRSPRDAILIDPHNQPTPM